jgi:hypothetical protein
MDFFRHDEGFELSIEAFCSNFPSMFVGQVPITVPLLQPSVAARLLHGIVDFVGFRLS